MFPEQILTKEHAHVGQAKCYCGGFAMRKVFTNYKHYYDYFIIYEVPRLISMAEKPKTAFKHALRMAY